MPIWRLTPAWLRWAIVTMLLLGGVQLGTVFGVLLPQIDRLQTDIARYQKPGDPGQDRKVVAWKKYRDIQRDLALFYQQIPDKTKLAEFMADLEGMTRKSGLEVNAIRFKPEMLKGARPKLLQYQLQFSVSGTYDQLYRFIGEVERSSRVLALKKIGFSQKGQDEEIKLTIALETFFLQGGKDEP